MAAVFAFLLLSFLVRAPLFGGNLNAIAVVSDEIRPYVLALEGFKEKGIKFKRVLYLGEYSEREVVSYLLSENATVVAIGSKALSLVLPLGKRVFYTMVLEPPKGEKACGMSLNIDPAEKIRILKRTLFIRGKIVIPFSVESFRGDRLKAFYPLLGVKVHLFKASSKKELFSSLGDICRKGDIFLFLPDPLFDADVFVSRLLKKLIFMGVVPVGFNRFFIESGAAVSFVFDYKKVGEKSAVLFKEFFYFNICRKESPPFTLVVNKKVLNKLEVELKENLPSFVEVINP